MMTQGFERKDAFQLWAIVNVRMRIAHIFVTLVLLRFCGTVVLCGLPTCSPHFSAKQPFKHWTCNGGQTVKHWTSCAKTAEGGKGNCWSSPLKKIYGGGAKAFSHPIDYKCRAVEIPLDRGKVVKLLFELHWYYGSDPEWLVWHSR